MSMLRQFMERTEWNCKIYYVELVETDFYVLFFPLNEVNNRVAGRISLARRRKFMFSGYSATES